MKPVSPKTKKISRKKFAHFKKTTIFPLVSITYNQFLKVKITTYITKL